MGRFEGRVAFVTGGARGQGRSHAIAFAQEGADIVICDVPEQIGTIPYLPATDQDLAETAAAIEALDRRCIAVAADVRDVSKMEALVARATAELGRLDILVSNHGISSYHEVKDMTEQVWQDMIDINLTGAFNVTRAVLPHMRRQQYGRIVLISSGLARQGQQRLAHYNAAKWGLIGFAKSVALEVAKKGITVNALLPTTVDTKMNQNEEMYRLFRPDLEHPVKADIEPVLSELNAMGIPWVDEQDITYGVLWLCAQEARYITGGGIDIGAGWNARSSS